MSETAEILELFPHQGKWTEIDYFKLPETNRIIELSGGRLIIAPAPTTQHQRISFRLSSLLGNYVALNNLGEVCYSPLDVRLWKDTIRQPDIVFMSNAHKDRITEKYWGVPDLAIEIVSEGTEREDRREKYYEYANAGVLEYWIVDPSKQSVEVFALEKGSYILFGKWGIGESAKSRLPDGFETSIDELMK